MSFEQPPENKELNNEKDIPLKTEKEEETPEQIQRSKEIKKSIREKNLRLYKDQKYDVEQRISSLRKQVEDHKNSEKEHLIDMPVIWEKKIAEEEEGLDKINDLIKNTEKELRDIEYGS